MDKDIQDFEFRVWGVGAWGLECNVWDLGLVTSHSQVQFAITVYISKQKNLDVTPQ